DVCAAHGHVVLRRHLLGDRDPDQPRQVRRPARRLLPQPLALAVAHLLVRAAVVRRHGPAVVSVRRAPLDPLDRCRAVVPLPLPARLDRVQRPPPDVRLNPEPSMSHDPNCIFCKLVDGKIPSRKAYEDDEILVFHDIAPWAPVHLLLIPKRHIVSMAEVTEADAPLLGRMMAMIPK